MEFRPELSGVFRTGRRFWLVFVGLILAFTIVYAPLALEISLASDYPRMAGSLAVLVFMSVAAVASFFAAQRAQSWTLGTSAARLREQLGWHLIAGACLTGIAARSVYVTSELRGGLIAATNATGEVISHLALIAFVAGIVAIPWADGRGRGLPFLLDAGIIFTSLLALFWVLLIGPAYVGYGETPLAPTTFAVHLIAAFVAFFVALWVMLRDVRPEFRQVAILLCLAIGLFAANKVARLAYAADIAHGQMTFINATTALAFVFVALAAILRTRVAPSSSSHELTLPTPVRLWQLILPYPFIMVAVSLIVVMVAFGWRVEHSLVVTLCVAATFFLLMARNFQALLDSRKSYHVAVEEARRDGLTGLFTHRTMHELLEFEIRRAEVSGLPVTVIFADLDRFKRCNDRFGHAFGDDVLVRVARTIERAVRLGDHVGRYGGEEFMVIAPGLGESSAVDLAERVRRSIEEQRHGNSENAALVTLSIGVAAFPGDLNTAAALIDGADQAMYQAKSAGGNRIVIAGREEVRPG